MLERGIKIRKKLYKHHLIDFKVNKRKENLYFESPYQTSLRFFNKSLVEIYCFAQR